MPHTILVVDNDPNMRITIRRMLETSGYGYIGAENAAHALAAFQEHRPAIVITDIYMPDRDGHQLIRDVRQQDGDVPIIAISGGDGLGDTWYLDSATGYGRVATLSKPFRLQQLADLVRSLLDVGD